jgi:hypothetical protein
MVQGGYPPQLEFLGKFSFWFLKYITSSVILRHLEAELTILTKRKVPKTHQESISTSKQGSKQEIALLNLVPRSLRETF